MPRALGVFPLTSKRLFFALVPGPAVRPVIERLHRRLGAEYGIAGRPVKPELYHVTLAFLGNQSAERLPLLLEIAARLQMPGCEVILDRLGSFSGAGVGWLGATGIPAELSAFQARLCMALDRAQIEFDRRPWVFHLTLYRDLRTPLARIRPGIVKWQLDGFALVESANTEHGPEYCRLGSWKAVPPAIAEQKV